MNEEGIVWPQDSVTVSGKILDDQKQPLPGATVIVKGTGIGTTTDADGKYSLRVPKDTKSIVISYVGFDIKEMPLTDPSKGTEDAIASKVKCAITGKPIPGEKARRGFTVRPSIRVLIKAQAPDFNEDSWINVDELRKFKLQYVQELAKSTGIKPELAKFMAKTVAEHAFLSNTYVDSLKEEVLDTTILEKLADNVAGFLGSWTFLIIFVASIVGWIVLMRIIPVDAYPYQFLNLLLGIFAACSAPLILISQNREIARDRRRLVNDFKVNLKNEFELMIIREKIDHIINVQNPGILEVLEMLSEDGHVAKG